MGIRWWGNKFYNAPVEPTPPPTPGLVLAVDNGANTGDGVSTNGTVNVTGLEAGAAWSYSINSGSTWIAGSGSSFVLAAGTYPVGTIRARQTDAAGNQSVAGQSQLEFVIYDPFIVPTSPHVQLSVSGTRGRLPSHVTRYRVRRPNPCTRYEGSSCQFTYAMPADDWSIWSNLPADPIGIRILLVMGTCPQPDPGPINIQVDIMLANGQFLSAGYLSGGNGIVGFSTQIEFDTTDPQAGPIP